MIHISLPLCLRSNSHVVVLNGLLQREFLPAARTQAILDDIMQTLLAEGVTTLAEDKWKVLAAIVSDVTDRTVVVGDHRTSESK